MITPQTFQERFNLAEQLLHSAIEKRGRQVYLDSVLHSLSSTLQVCKLEYMVHCIEQGTVPSASCQAQDRNTTTDNNNTSCLEATAFLQSLRPFLRHHEQSLRIAT